MLVYLDADNDLEADGIADLNEMEAATLPAGIHVAVEMDRIKGDDSSNGNWTDTRRGPVVHDNRPSVITSPLVSIGEKDMGSPATLTSFIKWGVKQYPANHYALVLWDHGGGLDGICYDDTSLDHLTIAETAKAITAAGTHFDVIGMDLCLAGLYEQLYSLRNNADVLAASESDIPAEGWDYTDVLNRLAAAPAMGAEQFGSAIVHSYAAQYGRQETLAATRTSAYAGLMKSLWRFSDTMLATTKASDWNAVSQARRAAPWFDDPDDRDLGVFMTRLSTSAASAAIRSAAKEVLDAMQQTQVDYCGLGRGSLGISIYIPTESWALESYTASEYDLLEHTHWRNFLAAFARQEAALARRPLYTFG